MGYFEECVITVINIKNGSPVAETTNYTFDNPAFFSWELKEIKSAKSLPTLLANDTLLMLYDSRHQPDLRYNRDMVHKIRTGFGKPIKYRVSISQSLKSRRLLYHLVLPEYSVVDNSGNVEYMLNFHDNRQTVTWAIGSWSANKGVNVLIDSITFRIYTQEEFNKTKEKVPRKILSSQVKSKITDIGKNVVVFASLVSELLKLKNGLK